MSVLLYTEHMTSILVVWSICIGACLAFIINYIYRTVAGPLVRTLMAYDHISEESAASLDELKMNKRLLRLLLRDGSPLRAYVSVVGGEIPSFTIGKRKSLDFISARFYVEESKKKKALNAFGEPERLIFVFVFIALAIGCAYGMSKIVPLFLS